MCIGRSRAPDVTLFSCLGAELAFDHWTFLTICILVSVCFCRNKHVLVEVHYVCAFVSSIILLWFVSCCGGVGGNCLLECRKEDWGAGPYILEPGVSYILCCLILKLRWAGYSPGEGWAPKHEFILKTLGCIGLYWAEVLDFWRLCLQWTCLHFMFDLPIWEFRIVLHFCTLLLNVFLWQI